MNMPPVTHYKDEVPQNDTTQDVINQELEKEVKSQSQVEEKVELKVLPVTKTTKKNSANIVNVFRQKMALNGTAVELPSIGKTIEFKEISTSEQKDLSKLSMENGSRADILFSAMVALINRLSLDKNFDIREYTEFERISIMLNLQQINKINPEIKFTCSKCGRENTYKLDLTKLLKKFNKTYRPDESIDIETSNRKYTFVIGWQNVEKVEDFFRSYYKKYANSSKQVQETIDNLSQIEYIIMFIKSITVTELSDPDDTISVDLQELSYGDRVQIIDSLPQGIIFDEKTGMVSKILEKYVTPINDSFKYNDCSFCGAAQEGAMANVTDFMGY